MNTSKKSWYICLIIFLTIPICQCDIKEKFYRPDLPEQMCAIGLVDIDDTLSYDICQYCHFPYVDTLISSKKVYFEKSYQSEYSDGSIDNFREFTFTISDGEKDMFTYHFDGQIRNPIIEIPSHLIFNSGRKYFIYASEKDAPDIMEECIVPDPAPDISLVSLKTGISILDLPKEGCYFWVDGPGDVRDPLKEDTTTYTRRFAEIEFSFSNNNPESYYALFLIGSPINVSLWGDYGPGNDAPNFLNYNILESNTDGFFYKYKGGGTIQHFCWQFPAHAYQLDCTHYDTLNTFFIDGSKIPDGNCIIKISTYWDDVQYIPSFIEYFRVRLMSIPKEAYLFYKSLYTYDIRADDPFSELVNINGNIVGGNGIIALCRSRDLIVYSGQTGWMYDPFF